MIIRLTTSILLVGLAIVAVPMSRANDNAPPTQIAASVQDEPASDSTADGPLTIKQIMRYAMTQHLCKKVIKQQATPEEQQKLVELFEALAKCKPPVGSEESWDEKTAALVTAAQEVAAGKPAQKSLMEAANCAACHNAHRPK